MQKPIQKHLPFQPVEEEIVPTFSPQDTKMIVEAMASLLLQLLDVHIAKEEDDVQ